MASMRAPQQMPNDLGMAGRNLGARGSSSFGTYCCREFALHRFRPERGWAFAWRSLISGEMIFVSLGLGQLLMMGRDLNDMSR